MQTCADRLFYSFSSNCTCTTFVSNLCTWNPLIFNLWRDDNHHNDGHKNTDFITYLTSLYWYSYLVLTLCLLGFNFVKFCRGGDIWCPPLKSSKMKLSKHLMGQNRGSCGCPTYLDHFQLAVKCISCVCTCLSVHRVSEPIFENMWNTCGRHLAIVYMYLASLKSPILTNHMTL